MTKQTPQVASARPRRSPIGAKNRLSVRDKEDGYIYRIVNSNLRDDPDRVERFQEQGYELVPREVAGRIGDKRVDNASTPGSSEFSVGGGTKAVFMRIKKEWYDEDQAAKQQLVDDQEQTMKRPNNADYGKVDLT